MSPSLRRYLCLSLSHTHTLLSLLRASAVCPSISVYVYLCACLCCTSLECRWGNYYCVKLVIARDRCHTQTYTSTVRSSFRGRGVCVHITTPTKCLTRHTLGTKALALLVNYRLDLMFVLVCRCKFGENKNQSGGGDSQIARMRQESRRDSALHQPRRRLVRHTDHQIWSSFRVDQLDVSERFEKFQTPPLLIRRVCPDFCTTRSSK